MTVCRTIICRELMMSEQGCLERVLHTGIRYLPWSHFYSPVTRAIHSQPGNAYSHAMVSVNLIIWSVRCTEPDSGGSNR